MAQYLDRAGLETFWAKVKAKIEDTAGDIEAVADDLADLTTEVGKKAAKSTTLSGYGITDAYTKTQTDSAIGTAISGLGKVLNYKGTKSATSNLPKSGNKAGDVWIVTADDSEHVWNGSAWEKLGATIDLSGYMGKDGVSVTRSLTTGTKIGTITINGAATDLYCQTNTDEKVKYAASTENANLPILLGNSDSAGTGTAKFKSGITVNPSTGAITATSFAGKATSAGTADSATKATQDGNGNVIATTYLKSADMTALTTQEINSICV